MSHTVTPDGYRPVLSLYETQRAIGLVKQLFLTRLCDALHLKRVTAPLFIDPASGLNDNLNGTERPVDFAIPATGGEGEVVHSLAKWKRYALAKYDFHVGNGLVTDMNAIRRDEELDNLHSIYVDQWDWEKVIDRPQRTTAFLEHEVQQIVGAICGTLEDLRAYFPALQTLLCPSVTFITSQQLEDTYPDLTPKQREDAAARLYKTVFIEQIGGALRSGQPHDGRAPDYDDWALNGDLLFYDPLLDCALEISSMGIRVDAASLTSQLATAGCAQRSALPFHQALLQGELPLTIGGGIGQSRLCMLLLGKVHVGEVQVSLWDAQTLAACHAAEIPLL